LEILPKTLDEVYQRILDTISEEDQMRAATALRWLVFAKIPLTVKELAEASIINPNNDHPFDIDDRFEPPRGIFYVLSSLVSTYVEELDGKTVEFIRIAHFSVQEYLLSERMEPILAQIFRVEEFASEQAIAKSCLHYINSCGPLEDKKTALVTYPLLKYAASRWHLHVRACEKTGNEATELVCQFMNSESWMRNWTSLQSADGKAPPLYWAAYLKLELVAKSLIVSWGSEINAVGGSYGNALQAACIRGNEAIAKLLLEKGADLNAQGGPFGNALQAACFMGNEAVVKLLLEKGADPNAQGGSYGNALQAAYIEENEAIIKLLLEKGADPNAQGGYYGNALQAACYRGNEAITKLLLEKGADPNAQGGYYGNALQAACYNYYKSGTAIMRILLDSGADINAEGGIYNNALNAACHEGYDGEKVRLLLENGANFDAEGDNDIIRARSVQDYELLAKLLMARIRPSSYIIEDEVEVD
jgi:ankyrin repeat protein